jgi:predicted nucleic acid-binding protein
VIYQLDTSGFSGLMREDLDMAAWLKSIRLSDRVVTCTIARDKILFGLQRMPEGRRRGDLEVKADKLFASMPCEAVPASAGDFYARIKLAQQRRGLPLDENDLWIAATAMAIGATLVTRDSDFKAIAEHSLSAP